MRRLEVSGLDGDKVSVCPWQSMPDNNTRLHKLNLDKYALIVSGYIKECKVEIGRGRKDFAPDAEFASMAGTYDQCFAGRNFTATVCASKVNGSVTGLFLAVDTDGKFKFLIPDHDEFPMLSVFRSEFGLLYFDPVSFGNGCCVVNRSTTSQEGR